MGVVKLGTLDALLAGELSAGTITAVHGRDADRRAFTTVAVSAPLMPR